MSTSPPPTTITTTTTATSNTTEPTQSTTPESTEQRTSEAKTAFEASLRSVGANYETALRDRARTLHENSTVLDKQEADVRRATEQLAKQNDQLAKVADQARDGLKEIGDVQNWAELIERDLLIVEETVRLAEEEEARNHHGNGNGNGYGEDGALEGNGRVNGFGEQAGNGDKDGKKGKGWFQWW
ncbi:hypothetical protein ANOM_004703 [Aspergillus nomiae NRRL 13137]|uniref:Biogenesis of lysosome-related organelles complex 1 subunit 1 n=1 Tax=Aspergillus nomiae NRRL (strain ATCC 15546 / NRRL 13137 / CBS 260.88 / M93) TaxID=1509407 RepID=A0A0L1J3T1_ASPN3|nr:uncharacterized protein ANOM_004703 [Aspergillus nomiae NRRL 13137]KNG86335.1 hypothetical protein ANOM_004703 [Aspergillus nomiae NRRL 13137]